MRAQEIIRQILLTCCCHADIQHSASAGARASKKEGGRMREGRWKREQQDGKGENTMKEKTRCSYGENIDESVEGRLAHKVHCWDGTQS